MKGNKALAIEKEIAHFAAGEFGLSLDDRFVAWFVRAYLLEAEDLAVSALTGSGGDKAIDAIIIDHEAEIVFLIQGKFRRKRFGKAEKRATLIEFATTSERISDTDDDKFAAYLKGMNPAVATRLKEARKAVVGRKYKLRLMFV